MRFWEYLKTLKATWEKAILIAQQESRDELVKSSVSDYYDVDEDDDDEFFDDFFDN